MKKIIPAGLVIMLLTMIIISCTKEEKSDQLVPFSSKEAPNPSSFSYTIPKDLLEQELLTLMKVREKGTSVYQKASIRSLDEHYEITISE